MVPAAERGGLPRHTCRQGIEPCVACEEAEAAAEREGLEQAWLEAEKAYYLPDDGIVDWTLTLTHSGYGWSAIAWRSDTTDTVTDRHPSAIAALQSLTRLAQQPSEST